MGIAALGAALLAPAAANAATVELNGNDLRYEAADGELNSVTVTARDASVTFADPGKPIDVSGSGGTCGAPADGTVTCTLPRGGQVRVKLRDGDDRAEVVSGRAKLDGGDGNDTLIGGPADDELEGGSGDDLLQGRGGRDTFAGGAGFDRIDYNDHTSPVTASFDGVANDGSAGENELVPADAEFLFGSPGADTLSAGPTGSAIHGGPGPDLLLGGPGDDLIYGGKDGDELRGGGGIDRMFGDRGPDRIYAADGNVESVECGDDFDWVQADALDSLNGCEGSGDPPAAGSEGGGPGGGGGSAAGGGFGAGSNPVPPPQLGRTVTVAPADGVVTVRPPGGDVSTLVGGGDIPLGSVVDTTRGAVTLTAASDAGGKTQTAEFKGGAFLVRQAAGDAKPVTELVLKGAIDCSGVGSSRRVVAAGRKPSKRRLWGSGHGSFRTRGRHGSATVRGTIWLTEDRCDGTYTRVKRGVVAVRDFDRHKTVVVRAGKSYFAAAAKRKRR